MKVLTLTLFLSIIVLKTFLVVLVFINKKTTMLINILKKNQKTNISFSNIYINKLTRKNIVINNQNLDFKDQDLI